MSVVTNAFLFFDTWERKTNQERERADPPRKTQSMGRMRNVFLGRIATNVIGGVVGTSGTFNTSESLHFTRICTTTTKTTMPFTIGHPESQSWIISTAATDTPTPRVHKRQVDPSPRSNVQVFPITETPVTDDDDYEENEEEEKEGEPDCEPLEAPANAAASPSSPEGTPPRARVELWVKRQKSLVSRNSMAFVLVMCFSFIFVD